MGYDVKCNMKKIKVTPGPTSYAGDINENRTVSYNYKLNNGGLAKPPLCHKQLLIEKSLGLKNGKNRSISNNRSLNSQ